MHFLFVLDSSQLFLKTFDWAQNIFFYKKHNLPPNPFSNQKDGLSKGLNSICATWPALLIKFDPAQLQNLSNFNCVSLTIIYRQSRLCGLTNSQYMVDGLMHGCTVAEMAEFHCTWLCIVSVHWESFPPTFLSIHLSLPCPLNPFLPSFDSLSPERPLCLGS